VLHAGRYGKYYEPNFCPGHRPAFKNAVELCHNVIKETFRVIIKECDCNRRVYIIKGGFTHTMAFPCHAVPLRGQIVSFPIDLHSAAVFDSHMPCRSHAVLKATSQGYGRVAAGERHVLYFVPISYQISLSCEMERNKRRKIMV
jgi:hypothetical protein